MRFFWYALSVGWTVLWFVAVIGGTDSGIPAVQSIACLAMARTYDK